MNFQIKRFLTGLSRRQYLLLLVLIPVFGYLLLAWLIADRFTISQPVAVSVQAPLAVATSPVAFEPVSATLADPEGFFLDPFALRELESRLDLRVAEEDQRTRKLTALVVAHMTLNSSEDEEVQVEYKGDNRSLGLALVNYYADRLVRMARQGWMRSRRNVGETVTVPPMESPAVRVGEPRVVEQRSLWRPERLQPLLLTLFISLVIVLGLIGILEWSDPSFKSERQVARYLGVPLLGALPDLEELSSRLHS